MGKSRQIRDTKPKMGQMASRENCYVFPGHIVKTQDCPSKSGMDGHLILLNLKSDIHLPLHIGWKARPAIRVCSPCRRQHIKVAMFTMENAQYQMHTAKCYWKSFFISESTMHLALTLRTWKTESIHSWRYDSNSRVCVTSPPSTGAILQISCQRQLSINS